VGLGGRGVLQGLSTAERVALAEEMIARAAEMRELAEEKKKRRG